MSRILTVQRILWQTANHSRRYYSRPLGFAERVLLERERVNNWGTVTSVLLLDSNEELNQDHLRKALQTESQKCKLWTAVST